MLREQFLSYRKWKQKNGEKEEGTMVIDCWEKERETGEEKETIAMQEHATVSVAVSFIREV